MASNQYRQRNLAAVTAANGGGSSQLGSSVSAAEGEENIDENGAA